MDTPRCRNERGWIALVVLALGLAVNAAAQGTGARLANISTRGQVGTDADNLFGGFVISGGSKTVLVRAVGPGLAAFGVGDTLDDPVLNLFDAKNAVVASNNDWNAADAGAFAQVGAFPLPASSKDAVVVATLPAGAYTAQISGAGSANTGVAILEVYDLGGTGQLINIATRLQVGTGANLAVAGFVVSRGSGTRKLLVRGIGPALAGFGLSGTLADPKLTVLDAAGGEIAAAAANGSASQLTAATTQAGAFASGATDTAVIVNVSPGSYTVQLAALSDSTGGLPSAGPAKGGIALIEVYDITTSTGTPPAFGQSPRLFYTNLRSGNAASTASGYATVLFDPNTNTGFVSVAFSNLSSVQAGAHLVLGAAGGNGTFVLDLPRGQVNGVFWNFGPRGPFSTHDIVAALLSGGISVQIDTANFPAGEVRAALAPTRGSIAFSAPAAPPALPAGALASPTQTDAARFLTQSTFGPTTATIAALQARGISGWIDDQLALPMTSALATLRAQIAAIPRPFNPVLNEGRAAAQPEWHNAWWTTAVTAPDQLRQRVAFALSELLVVGADSSTASYYHEIKAKYHDVLAAGALGNFRQLLEDVSLNISMGFWLTYLWNQKSDPVKGTAPDENYARELQQLFTIGLVQLHPDGTLMLDAFGQPIPTYDQTTITETAKILTGWTISQSPENTANVNQFLQRAPEPPGGAVAEGSPWLQPMRNFAAFHDSTQKRIVSLDQVPLAQARPTLVPAGQTGAQDLKVLLDTLCNHPNTGPFVARHLIQRLVTANPSPGYVYRVAQVFANDGTGTRGNLAAVVRAILTDYEARSTAVLANSGYGKIKEPVLRLTAVFRALSFSATTGQFMDSFYNQPSGYWPSSRLNFGGIGSQTPLGSPTVFNFFSPTYSPPGALSAAGLVSPELEIVDSVWAIETPNILSGYLVRDVSTLPLPPSGVSPYLVPDYSALLVNARNPAALVDQLNLLFCANQMTAANRATIVGTLQSLPAAESDLQRVRIATQLVVLGPDGAVQR
jgi:uncharacterized protein (DUF1800 family)